MTSHLFAADLDRTLIYSAGALGLPPEPGNVRRLLCVEIYQGRPLSFLTETAAELLADLGRAGVLMPVTTRTVEQLARVSLPGPAPKFALCANGGRLLRDGVEDLDFTAAVTERLERTSAPNAEMLAELTRASATAGEHAFVEKVRDAAGLFSYAVVDRGRLPQGWVEELTGFAEARAWSVSLQGSKLYLVPRLLSKGAAAREVAVILGAEVLLAAGDSLLDRTLLEEADRAIRPAHGELHDTGWLAPHVEVTRSIGVRAGEEIVRWAAEVVAGC